MFALFENLTNWLWGLPLLITILVTGIYLTIRSGFFQFRHFGHIVKNMFSKERREEGGDDGKSLTPFQAISIAIGGTVGVSNMSGVATAIATGGPGALFWLWVAALLAMVIKMTEVTLAVYYREKQPNGEYLGGPTYYMQKGLGDEKKLPFWKIFAVLFGGNWLDCVAAGVVGLVLALAVTGASRLRFNDFCQNAAGSFALAVTALLIQRLVFFSMNIDAVIISAIMPMVPGVTFTAAIRDTLNGDYSSGVARIAEAIVVALGVASGVGAAMVVFGMMGGGL